MASGTRSTSGGATIKPTTLLAEFNLLRDLVNLLAAEVSLIDDWIYETCETRVLNHSSPLYQKLHGAGSQMQRLKQSIGVLAKATKHLDVAESVAEEREIHEQPFESYAEVDTTQAHFSSDKNLEEMIIGDLIKMEEDDNLRDPLSLQDNEEDRTTEGVSTNDLPSCPTVRKGVVCGGHMKIVISSRGRQMLRCKKRGCRSHHSINNPQKYGGWSTTEGDGSAHSLSTSQTPSSRAAEPVPNPIKCQYCGKVFSCTAYRTRHERVHTGVKPFKCAYCDKAFSDPSAKTKHQRLHTGVKPYKCQYCNLTFISVGSRRNHDLKHTGERPFVCEFCGQGFTQSSILKNHRLTHTKERPHGCEKCGRTFTRHEGLKLHKCFNKTSSI